MGNGSGVGMFRSISGDDLVATFVALRCPITTRSLALGEDFLRLIFPERPAQHQGRDPSLGEVLEEVVADIDAAHPLSKVVIPLTAGLDSRAVLGAALRVVGRDRILCFTVGERRNEEVVAAKEVCRRNGLDHVTVDPGSYPWDAEAMVAHAEESFRKYRAFCSVENPLFASFRDHCRRIYGQDYYMLSGFMGDVGSGGGLIAPEMGAGVEPALEEFVLQNRTFRDYRPDASLAGTISAFCERMHDEIRERGYPGITHFDVLEIGLEMALRLRGGLHGGDIVYAPHADPRIMSWWYGQILRERMGQVRYRQELAGRYGEVFCLVDDKVRRAPAFVKRQRSLGERVVNKVVNMVRGGLGWGRGTSERGDLRTDTRKRDLFVGLVEEFGQRRLVDLDTNALLEAFSQQPMGRSLALVKSVATVEMHIRAGNVDRLRSNAPLAGGEAGMPPSRRPLARIA